MQSFYNEAQVEVGETRLRLVVNMRTIDATEALTGLTMPKILSLLLGNDPPLSLGGKVLWGMLREHHPEVTLDEALGLMFAQEQDAIGIAMGDLFRRAFHIGKAKDENPPKRRGASKPSSQNGSRQKQEA